MSPKTKNPVPQHNAHLHLPKELWDWLAEEAKSKGVPTRDIVVKALSMYRDLYRLANNKGETK